ncbi:hypothetical protein ACRRTK_021180 [Alexandromys fortis]
MWAGRPAPRGRVPRPAGLAWPAVSLPARHAHARAGFPSSWVVISQEPLLISFLLAMEPTLACPEGIVGAGLWKQPGHYTQRDCTMDCKESCPSVSIPSSDEHREKKKRFTLKKQFPAMALKIPAKRIFGDNFDPDFIKQRRAGLNEFIQNLVRYPELYNHWCSPLAVTIAGLLFLVAGGPLPPFDYERAQMSEPSFRWTAPDTSQIHPRMKMKEVLRSAKPSDFDFLKVIGKGSFGKVLLAKRKLDGKFYAVKVLQKKIVLNRKEQKHIMAERNVLLKNVKHPFLVGLHYSFQTTEKLYFVLDFVNGGELFFHLQRERSFPEHRARFYAAEIASALGYLHSIKIVYRDLKPENILLDSMGHVVLTDFGLCKEGIAISDTTTTFCGTPEYLAPEVIRKQPYDNTVDWWCLGAVLYEMLYGLLEIQNHPFFESLSWTDLVQKKIPPPFNPNVAGPDDIRNFDTVFTEEAVPYSVCVSSDYSIVNASVLEADDAFVGFSYAPPSEDLFL